MTNVATRMSWRRVVNASVVLALVVAVALLAPMLWHYQESMAEHVRAILRPRPASDAQQAAIVRAVFDRWSPDRAAYLSEKSLALCPEDKALFPKACMPAMGLTSPQFTSDIPLRLRRELAMANSSTFVQPDPGIATVAMISTEEDDMLGLGRLTSRLELRHPGAVGFNRTSRAVLAEDGIHAAVAFAHFCGDLCGVGIVYYLEFADGRWRVVSASGLWVS